MGCVYFIQEGRGGPIKIGWSALCAAGRLASMQTGNSIQLHLLKEIPAESRAAERTWHFRFAKSRIRGEWFKPSRSLIRAIRDERSPFLPPPPTARLGLLFDELGGSARVAKAMNVEMATAYAWARRGRLPYWHFGKLIKLAEKCGLTHVDRSLLWEICEP